MKDIYKTIAIALAASLALQACKKNSAAPSGGGNTTDTTTTPIVKGTDPSVATTQGFFLDGWTAKTWTAPASQTVSPPSANGAVSVTIDLSQVTTKVSPYIFGNNVNPFMGQIATVPTLMGFLKNLSPNIVRAPGGSLSDVYFWNGDGATIQAPADAPVNLLDNQGNSSAAYYWFGSNTADWTLSIDNYYKALQQINATGLITVNYGYARYGLSAHPDQVAAHLAAQWVRYDKGKTQFWEIGNECYGNWEAGYRIDVSKNKDGQPEIITGSVYGTHFKVFADSMRAAAAEVGNTNIKIGAVLTTTDDRANNAGVSNWNAGVLSAAGNSPDFFVVHNYYTPYADNSTASVILGTPASQTSLMMNWVKTSVQSAGVTQKPVAMDEWNIQATGSSQQVSNIAGIHAVMTLGEILSNQISMASRWDMANAWGTGSVAGDDQGMFSNSSNSSEAEPGAPAWNPRPAFFYMYYFQKFFGDRMVASSVSGSTDILSYGSSWSSGQAGTVLLNTGSTDHVVKISFKNFSAGNNFYYYTLNGGTDNAPFSHKVYVNGSGPATASGGPANYASLSAAAAPTSGGIIVSVPAYGAVFLVADKK